MQAHPLSSPAARSTTTSHPTSSKTPLPASIPPPTPGRVPSKRTAARTHATASPVADTVGLAHDAGNFLAALGLYCDLLSAPGVLRPEHLHYATELNLISNRSSELIRRLLSDPTASTPDSPPATTTAPKSLRLSARTEKPRAADAHTPNDAFLLRTLAPVLQQIAAGAARVSVSCPPSLPPLGFSCEIIERIAVNLVRNAAQAIRLQHSNMPSSPLHHSGHIRVSLALIGSHLDLTVEDNGPGMPPSVAAAFLRPSPLPRGATRGLGHRIIHELAATTAGHLQIRVLPGSGTVFSIQWPLPSTPPAKTLSPVAPSTQSHESHETASKGFSTC